MISLKLHLPSLAAGILLGMLLALLISKFSESDPALRADFLNGPDIACCRLDGFSAVESWKEGKVRWSYGPEASIEFFLADPKQCQELLLVYKFINPLEGQHLEILFNGKVMANEANLPAMPSWNKWYGQVLSLHPKVGTNTIIFRVSKWNGHGSFFAKEDSRPLSLIFQQLAILPR